MAKLAQELIKSLYAMGVRYAFGIPGGPSIPYMEAMKNEGIEFITVANEQSAGFMADVFGRLTGIPGVCHGTFGPGATNLSTGVGGALLDRSPLIAFTTEFKDDDLGRRIQMNIDHQELFRPITKWSTRLSKDNFNYTISNAFKVATAETPGPVHIGLPNNIDGDFIDSSQVVESFERVSLPSPEEALLQEAITIIEKSKKPILAVGLTAIRYGLSKEILEFASKNNLPVVVTPMAKGIIPVEHPCFAGVVFHAKSDQVAEVYRNADLVIGVGYDSIEFNYESWMPKVPLIHIDTEGVDVPEDYDVACEVLGSIEAAMAYLNSKNLPPFGWDLKEVQENKKKVFEALRPKTKGFNPSDAIAALQEIMPKDGILTADVGAHLHLLGQLWNVNSGKFLMTNGWSSMGFGIPSAIGAKLCKPSNAVACVTGDGGFLMNCGELMVARRLGLNVVIVVFVDQEYSLIKVKQEWKKVPQYATSVKSQGEYFNADHFLGVPILKARDKDEMKQSLISAFGAPGPVIIEAVVDGSVYQDLITRNYK